MKRKYQLIPKEAWGPGCYLDIQHSRLYGADGIVYNNVEINRADLERFLNELKQKERPQ